MTNPIGAEFREVQQRDHEGKPALVVIAARTYDTSVEDLWDAITSRERIPRWFLPIEGELRLGGRYQLQGNAGGTITRCDPPEALDVTWEFGGGVSWVNLRLAASGQGARLTLEHIAHKEGVGEEHLQMYGPGAVGIGWDLGFMGLGIHIATGGDRPPEADPAWMASDEAKAFMRESGEAWGAAEAASGEDPNLARERAERTIAFYTGG
ncbi:MAG TPA: SRPBCC family protein [Azospirillaceae bacterium]|nr:SRPBCC family protein [Azospirillaceae bacterium]